MTTKLTKQDKALRSAKVKKFIIKHPNLSIGEYAKKLKIEKSVVSGVFGAIIQFGTDIEKASLPSKIVTEQTLSPKVVSEKKVVSPKLKVSKKVNEIQDFIIKNRHLSREDVMKNLGIDMNTYRVNLIWVNRRENQVKAFPHEQSETKEIVYRDCVIKAIKQSKISNGTIVGLPAEKALTETRIYNEVSKKFKFVGIEKEKDIYYQLLSNLGKQRFLEMNIIKGELGEYLAECKENSLSHLIADYCGQLHTYENEITDFIKRNLVVVDGIIAITINKRISSGRGDGAIVNKFYDNLIALNDASKSIDCKVEKAFRIYLDRVCGFDYKIETLLDYRSEKGQASSNMMLAIIRRIK